MRGSVGESLSKGNKALVTFFIPKLFVSNIVTFGSYSCEIGAHYALFTCDINRKLILLNCVYSGKTNKIILV